MTLIASISGIRGTIGGAPGENLTPIDAVQFASAFAAYIKESSKNPHPKVVIGRDARPSGGWLSSIVSATLQASGVHVIDLQLSTTPTVEVAVTDMKADGGIILTASHNPIEWNALKLLNAKGEFISAAEGAQLLKMISESKFSFPLVTESGSYQCVTDAIERHIDHIVQHPLVDVKLIRNAQFRVAVDPVNSSGGIAVPALLARLGVSQIHMIHGEPTGIFAHNPEPLKEHLSDICAEVVSKGCDVGIVVDPDVDRLAFISENGEMFGEEYTLVAIADYVLGVKPGSVVSNLSSSRALKDIASRHGQSYFASAVGEVNVVQKMKECGAVIGGEGNGGIIVPDFHYGRDALIGIALFLTHLAIRNVKMSEMRGSYPRYEMAKNKVILKQGMDPDELILRLQENHRHAEVNMEDGLKIDFSDGWVHLRKSNTEPIIRIYTESDSSEKATALARQFEQELISMI